MASCSICGKDLGFLGSMSGKEVCEDCEKAEQDRQIMVKNAAMNQLHDFLKKNLDAKTTQDLIEWGMSEATKRSISSCAHSIKSDEKIYVLCNAVAKELKYIKSVRQGTGFSVPIHKGFRVSSYSGESTPLYDYRDVADGILALTNKNIHLCASSGKPIKIPYTKIEGFRVYNDGLEVYRGTQKPTLFFFNEVDTLQSDVIGHIIELNTR